MSRPPGPGSSGADDDGKVKPQDNIQNCRLSVPDGDGAPHSGIEYLLNIASQMSDTVILVNRDMDILFLNDAAKTFLEAAINAGCDETFMNKPGYYAGNAAKLAFTTGEVQRTQVSCGKNSEILLDVVATPIRVSGGDITECLVIGRDLSALRGSVRQKIDMLSMLSHDIRTPLTTIKSYTELLLDSADAKNTVCTEILGKINAVTNSTSVLMDDFITLSKFDSGCIVVNPVPESMDSLVSVALDSLSHIIESSSASVHVSIPDVLPRVMVDSDRFGRVITNLVANALRYGQKGVNISISARVDAENSAGAILEISDNGPGIPEEELPHVFDRYFSRGQGGNTDGHGLGMMIVKTITELHGGAVSVKSRKGEGTVVKLWLPTAPSTH